MQVQKYPKIAFIFDPNHYDEKEKSVTKELLNVIQNKKIFTLIEGKCFEHESLNQYSLELRASDKLNSTSTACSLLICHMLFPCPGFDTFLKTIIEDIYFDPYFKTLFLGEYYKKYNPKNYGYTLNNPLFSFKYMTLAHKAAIKLVRDLFIMWDAELHKQPLEEQEKFYIQHLTNVFHKLKPSNSMDPLIFGPISAALAFIKIGKVNENLGENLYSDKELTLSISDEFYGGKETGLAVRLNIDYRSQFQAEKLILVVEKILNLKSNATDSIFIVRVGISHREIILKKLRERFVDGDFREMQFEKSDLGNIVSKIEKEFSSTKILV